jgi:hypothetical protein
LDKVYAWLERLLRFCEVNGGKLKKRFLSEWHSDARILFVDLAALFGDAFIRTGDLRYLNVLLKMLRTGFVPAYHSLPNMEMRTEEDVVFVVNTAKAWAAAAYGLVHLGLGVISGRNDNPFTKSL